MAFGGILLAATTLGVVTFDPMVMVAGLAALLGGGVVIKVSKAVMKSLDITGDPFYPEWNYTIRPRQPASV